MLTYEKLENLIIKYDIAYNHNILPAFKKEKTSRIFPVGSGRGEPPEQPQSFFIGFFTEGICIFPTRNDWEPEDPVYYPWEAIRSFEVKKGALSENELRFATEEKKIVLKLPRWMMNNPWVKENNIFLESVRYNSRLNVYRKR